MTNYDAWKPITSRLIKGLAAKPGVKIVDQAIAADFAAQAIHGMAERGELPGAQRELLAAAERMRRAIKRQDRRDQLASLVQAEAAIAKAKGTP